MIKDKFGVALNFIRSHFSRIQLGGKSLTHVYLYALTSIAILALAFNAIKFGLYSDQDQAIKTIRSIERQLVQSDKVYSHLLDLQLSSSWQVRNQNIGKMRDSVKQLIASQHNLSQLSPVSKYCQEYQCLEREFSRLNEIEDPSFRATATWAEDAEAEIKKYKTQLGHINIYLDELTTEANSNLILLDIAFLACLLFFLTFQAIFIFKPAVSKLDHALSVRSDFLSRISHEIRNPMNAILGMAEVLKGTKINFEQRQYIDSLLRAGQTLLEMLNNLIDVAAVEGKNVVLKASSFHLFQMVDKTSQVVSSIAHQKGIEFFVKVDPRLNRNFISDVGRLEQVLINLLNNAVKFTPKGYVLLELALISENEDSCRVCFSVKDTGIGIEKDKTEEIFNSFVQEDSSIKRQYGGSGLGLSIASEILSLMGSQLKVTSEKGIGSQFFFEITLVADTELPESKNLDATAPGVLLFTGQFSKVMDSILDESFGTFYVCESEQELRYALEISKVPLHVIVDDSIGIISMISVPKIVQGDERVLSLNALLKTSFPKENVDLIRKSGYSDFLLKPFRPWLLEAFEGKETLVHGEESEGSKLSEQKFPLRVLAVDDSEDNLFLIQEILTPFVQKIDFASNGQEAVDMVQATEYDIVFMDIQMPIMDGYTAIRHIRKIDKKNIPVIAVTAHGGVIDEKRCLEAGFSARLVKPIGRSQLIEVIEEFYGSNHSDNKTKKTEMDPIILKLLPTFFSTREADLNFVSSAIEAEDFDQIKALGHKVKGSSLSYGFKSIGQKGKALEDAAADRNLALCKKLYNEMLKDIQSEKDKYLNT